MSKSKYILSLLMLFLILFTSIACSSNNTPVENTPISEKRFFLGTLVDITLYDKASDELFDEIFNHLKNIEAKMTINRDTSEVVDINLNAGKSFVKVSEDTFYVIERGKYFSKISNGRFDISIGPLVKLWNIGSEDAQVPSEEDITLKKNLVDYNKVLLNRDDKSVMLKEKGMILDLGAIAKGYIADVISDILKEHNVKHAIINLGGNVFAYGNKPDGTPWRIGIQNPFSPRGDFLGVVNVSNKTVVTSGIYERYLEANGKRYHHILDPDTGYPVENNLGSVSIIANKSIDADSLSTSAFSSGVEKGMKLIEDLDNVEAIFITKDKEIYMTSGLEGTFELMDSSFTIKTD